MRRFEDDVRRRRRRRRPAGLVLVGVLGSLSLLHFSGRRPEEHVLLSRTALTLHLLQVEVVLLEQRGQLGADATDLDPDLVADLRGRLLEHCLLGDEVFIPPRAKGSRIGLVERPACIELVDLPRPVRLTVGAVRARDRCERGLVAVTAPTACEHAQPRRESRGGADPESSEVHPSATPERLSHLREAVSEDERPRLAGSGLPLMANCTVFPDFFQAYVPDPHTRRPCSRSVIVVAVAVYFPRAMGWPFNATVIRAALDKRQRPLPLELGGL